MDAPIVIADGGIEQTWRPEDNGGAFIGPTRLRDALVRSRNLVSIRLLRAVGTADVIDYAVRFGFDRAAMPNNLTLALGTLPATPLQVATGYAAFANGGYKIDPYFIDRIEDGTGATVWRAAPREVCVECAPPPDQITAAVAGPAAGSDPPASAGGPGVSAAAAARGGGLTMAPPAEERSLPLVSAARRAPQIITPANAWLMDDLMADVIKRGTGRRALVLGRSDISGKTGTTNKSNDTWFNGFNPNLVATVWVGFDQDRPLGEGEEGSSVAVPIWVRLMREALRSVPDVARPMPPGLVSARINATSGLLAAPTDAEGIDEYFSTGKLPAAANAAGVPANGNSEPLF
jgi:penicillin-binding protein 1A